MYVKAWLSIWIDLEAYEADVGNNPALLFHLTHWYRVSQSNLELIDRSAFASQLALGILSLPSEAKNASGPLCPSGFLKVCF